MALSARHFWIAPPAEPRSAPDGGYSALAAPRVLEMRRRIGKGRTAVCAIAGKIPPAPLLLKGERHARAICHRR